MCRQNTGLTSQALWKRQPFGQHFAPQLVSALSTSVSLAPWLWLLKSRWISATLFFLSLFSKKNKKLLRRQTVFFLLALFWNSRNKEKCFQCIFCSWEPKSGLETQKELWAESRKSPLIIPIRRRWKQLQPLCAWICGEGTHSCFVGWTFLDWQPVAANCKQNFAKD